MKCYIKQIWKDVFGFLICEKMIEIYILIVISLLSLCILIGFNQFWFLQLIKAILILSVTVVCFFAVFLFLYDWHCSIKERCSKQK
jgi:hypothetical protein